MHHIRHHFENVHFGKDRVEMCSGSIFRNMLVYSFPLMLSGMLQLLFNAADVAVAGKFAGDLSLAAVGSNGALVNLFVNLFIGFSVGTNVIVARQLGAGKNDSCSKAVHTSFLVSLFGGLLLTLMGELFADKILVLMQTPQTVLPLATLYLRVYFFGTPFLLLYNFGNAVLRSIGDTKRPLLFLTISGVVNVALNLVFVIVLQMDVAGVALATVISQSLSAFLVVFCLLKEEEPIRLHFDRLKIDPDNLKAIVLIGLPAGLQSALFSVSNVIIQSSINIFGDTVMSGSAAAVNIEGFVYTAMNSYYQSTVSFTSRNMGAEKYGRVPKIALNGVLCAAGIGCIMALIVNLFARPLLGIYSSTGEVILVGIRRIRIICIPYFLMGMMDALVGALRGIGYSLTPMFVSLMGIGVFRVVWVAVVLSVPSLSSNVENIYWSYPFSWLISVSILGVCYVVLWQRRKAKLSDHHTD